jgi:hypothetical protein
MDPPLDRDAIAELWPKQPDCLLPAIARCRYKLIQDLAPLRPAARLVPIAK